MAEKTKKMKTPALIARIVGAAFCALAIEALFIVGAVGTGFSKGDAPFVIVIHASAIVCAALAVIRLFLGKKPPLVFRWIVTAALPFAVFYLVEFLTHDPFSIKWEIIALNLVVYYLLAATVALLTGRTWAGITAVAVIHLIFGFISYYTTIFRSSPLFPWDLASAGTAATVVSAYRLELPMKLVFVAALGFLVIELSLFAGIRLKLGKWYIRAAATVLAAAMLGGSVAYIGTDDAISRFGLYPYLFTPGVLYKRNGFTVSFLMNLRYMTVEKPSGYSPEAASRAASLYESDGTDGGERPNVIVIMNEALAEMKYLAGYETNEPYFPFIDSLEDNTVKGRLHMSVIGGNTPNSEFEFLTGLTMGFLPEGSIPYQQFVKSSSPSLAGQLADLGYRTVGMHPYYKGGWRRDEIYPFFGFSETHFLDSSKDTTFKRSRKIRNYVTDEAVVDSIIDIYEESDDPLFVFAVTMQNHGGYWDKYDNFTPEVTVNGLEDSFVVSSYLSLVRESDKAFEKLVEYFRDADEKTIIVMFGDHQPGDAVANPLLKLTGRKLAAESVDDIESRYVTPYVIWTNFDLDYTAPADMSADYLAAVVADIGGIPKTASQKFLLDLMKEYPTVNAKAFTDSDGTLRPISEYGERDALLDYARLQYAYLFDRKNAPIGFWELK
ncbi:MAG: LTA synthase family protein [Clostridia bacterium]|nr:LTA synthase family protein [Clostridia bacterium]